MDVREKSIARNQEVKKTVHLLTVGSVLGMGRFYFDAMVYQPKSNPKDNTIGVIRHFKSVDSEVSDQLKKIDTRTTDYKNFIDQICNCSKVISSSLHGIILAESYGIPAVFLQENMDNELIKFYDWYYSTNRKNIKIAYSIEEAIEMQPMALPDLESMRKNLLEAFPYDLWEN